MINRQYDYSFKERNAADVDDNHNRRDQLVEVVLPRVASDSDVCHCHGEALLKVMAGKSFESDAHEAWVLREREVAPGAGRAVPRAVVLDRVACSKLGEQSAVSNK